MAEDDYALPIAVVIIIVLVGIMLFVQASATPTFTDVATFTDVEIRSLSLNQGIHGSFILGSGTVDGVPMYAGYKVMPDGSFHYYTVPAGKSNIYTDTEDKPYIRVWYTETKFNNHSIFTTSPYLYDVHVPNGTITQEYHG